MFSSYLGCVKCVTAPLQISSQAIPKFCKARTVIYTLREAVDRKLVEHMQQGEISPVQHSEWEAPLVCIPKCNGSVRVCSKNESIARCRLVPSTKKAGLVVHLSRWK